MLKIEYKNIRQNWRVNLKPQQKGTKHMAKIDNAVRIVEFESEYDLYSQMEKDLNNYFIGESSKCCKLKNFQLIDKNHAILYFEEDPDIIMVRFIYNKEILKIDDASEVNFFSIQEISFMDSLGVVTIGDTQYEIEEIEYVIDFNTSRHADIYLN